VFMSARRGCCGRSSAHARLWISGQQHALGAQRGVRQAD
jgi:hypothetical protein